MLSIPIIAHPEDVEWFLPPSKSHMIRWIALSSQCKSSTRLSFQGIPGSDVVSMANCMEELGASIEKGPENWVIRGNRDGLHPPKRTLDCGNSATAAKILTAIVACFDSPVSIDGDASLRKRDFAHLISSLRDLGCEVSSESLPYSITGPISRGGTIIDESVSSQTVSGMVLSSPGFESEVEVEMIGEAVSRWYRELTIEISKDCGWPGSYGKKMSLSAWDVETPENVEIPPEISLLPISILFDKLHGTRSMSGDLTNIPRPIMEAIGLVSLNNKEVDLRDSSDIIAPCAAIMALGRGGEIVGASHARGKESDRISSTVRMLASFGMEASETSAGLSVPGGQDPSTPENVVDCELDHRLAMTAGVLATRVGATLSGYEICRVTHPGFFEMILGHYEGL